MADHPEQLRPIPSSREAFHWLESLGSHEIEDSVARIGQRVREIVPECVALSVTMAEDQLTFTLTAELPVHPQDPLQFLESSGPAAAGITSTLFMPVMRGAEVVGGLNLYASVPGAFDGHHDEIAAACGAWAEGAVTNADLPFTSQIRASAAPGHLQDRCAMDVATGYVAALREIGIEEAAELIRTAAGRAGVTVADFSRFVLEAHMPQDDPQDG